MMNNKDAVFQSPINLAIQNMNISQVQRTKFVTSTTHATKISIR